MKLYKAFYAVWLFVLALLVSGCVGVPDGVTPVTGFEVNRYLGKWYEIARLDHSFERGLEQVTAEYSPRDDGDIRVLNRGYNTAKQQWQEAEGRARFVGSKDVGQLKVSFFGPFYGGYNIVELDPNYQYVMIVGNDRDYLWILSRTPQLDVAVQQRLVDKAKSLGFATEKLIFVKQD
ncbi:MAG TPA: lipocalin family protein [Candidatus Thiothrix moscowensis]|uniref:lipocalin family protein n=1 Tax=unclassified Thiothrix TaxID=2636184 RepID=UPI001A2BFA5A|nr:MULTISPECIES: lipocalin family protein [unclassified Thiothrix]MBJ6611833.1 lipocalin family protein [Candidatus Thiothrix moscowensis]HRJ54430.1 lipocalin family protein [Candidatus Thiothrix moscowensis]HRJ94706.1 lipocalin family protein [Candidatus Thiothrix moscowensis]